MIIGGRSLDTSSLIVRIKSGNAWIDILAILALLLLHPVLYHLDSSRGYFPPDAVGYLVFAENFLAKGLLYVESGIAGTGQILPPFYPFLILIGNILVGDVIITSELVSSVSVIASSVVFYFIIRQFGGTFLAFVGALGVQLNYQLNLWAISPLTEATFILVLACSLWLSTYAIRNKGFAFSFVLGVMLALVFFTRQVGIILIPFFLLVIFVASPRKFHLNSLAVIVGLGVLLVPYIYILNEQGNEIGARFSAFDQSWSKHEKISINDVEEETQIYLRQLRDLPSDDYGDVYVKRRMFRQLLPDSSAMLQDIDMEPLLPSRKGVRARLLGIWTSLDEFDDRLLSNIKFIYESVGFIVCFVFCVTLMTPIWISRNREFLLSRLLIGGFVLFFLLSISLLTGLIDRYVLILVPFMLLHIFREAAWLLRQDWQTSKVMWTTPLFFSIVVFACAFSQPTNYSNVQLFPKGTLEQIGESNFRKFVGSGELVFAIGSFHAFVAGGTWAVLPNDSLEKIAEYAAHTGVRWMVVVHKPQPEVSAYKLAKNWYLDKSLLRQYRHLVDLRAVSRDGQSFLFEFKAKQ
jgi:hypothetical protein